MHKQTQAELHVLDRVLYLLEERSVVAAAEHNPSFRNYLEGLYASVNQKASHLE